MQKYDEINFKTNPNPTSSFYGDGFSQYETLLALIQRINDMIDSNNLNVDEIEDLKQKKLDIETYLNDIKNNRKLDENGDFKGTWFGLEMHETDEGLATDWNNAKGTFDTVTDRMNDVDENISEHETLLVSHSASLADITYLITQDLSETEVTNILKTRKNIKVCEGIYNFSSQLIFQDNLNIVFEKNAKLNYTGTELVAIKLGNNTTLTNFNLASQNKIKDSYGIQASGKSNINIIGGTVDGFGFANVGISTCNNVNIQGVNSINCGNKADGTDWYGQGIWVDKSEDVIINGNNIKDNGMHGIQVMASKNVIATDNICSENGDCGITFNTIDIFKISDNICEHNGVNGGPYGGQGIQVVGNSTIKSKDGAITGNTCRNNLENGIEVTTYCEDITVDDNISKYNNWGGIAINPNCESVSVGDNVCKYNQHGISCVSVKIIQISGNITNYNKENGVSISSCDCVNVDSFISLNNGQVVSDRCGVLVTGSSNVDVKNGKTYDNQDIKTQSHGIRYYNVNSGECCGNIVSGNKTNTVLISGSTNIILNNQDDISRAYQGLKDKNSVKWCSGSGSPEGIITASIGSIYLRTDGSTSTTLYIKESDIGNTGWVAK